VLAFAAGPRNKKMEFPYLIEGVARRHIG